MVNPTYFLVYLMAPSLNSEYITVTFPPRKDVHYAASCCFLGDDGANSFCFIYPMSLYCFNQMKACGLT